MSELPENTSAPSANALAAKLPERPKFISPMPSIQEADDSVPVALTVVASFAALVTLTFAVLLYLKR